VGQLEVGTSVGTVVVGAYEGSSVGQLEVGTSVGKVVVGACEGSSVGQLEVGTPVGKVVVGACEGSSVGQLEVGTPVGTVVVGACEGSSVGSKVVLVSQVPSSVHNKQFAQELETKVMSVPNWHQQLPLPELGMFAIVAPGHCARTIAMHSAREFAKPMERSPWVLILFCTQVHSVAVGSGVVGVVGSNVA